MADPEDPEEAGDVDVTFTPSYHLEWLLGEDIEIVFEPEGDA